MSLNAMDSVDSPPWTIRRPSSLEGSNEGLRTAMLELNDARGFGSLERNRYARNLYGDDDLASAPESYNKHANARSKHWSFGWICLTFSALFSGLGNSLEPVSALAWLSIVLLILGFEQTVFYFDEDSRFWAKLLGTSLFIVVTQGLGGTLGFSSVFGYPNSTFYTVMESFTYGLILSAVYVVLTLYPHYAFERRYPNNWFTFFVFPASYTVVTHLLIGRYIGTMITVGNALLDYLPLRQFASIIGLPGITFIATFTANIAALNMTKHDPYRTRKMTKYTIYGFLLAMVTTGFLMYADSFYQKNVSTLVVPTVSVSCIVAQNAVHNSSQWIEIWSSIDQRIAAGDSIILTAEESFTVSADDDEAALLNLAKEAAVSSTTEVYIGISYMKQSLLLDDTKVTNHFALITPSGDLAWNYLKAHPVPGVEDNVVPGSGILPIYDTQSPLGRLSGAICFDLDYPEYILQAGQQQVDLFLQPSWTWNAISSRHFETNAVRAVENGFTLFRCSSNGESGIVDPRGKVQQRQFTGHSPLEKHVFSLPLNRRVQTLYASAGYGFEWLCLAVTACFYLAVLIPAWAFQFAFSYFSPLDN